MRLLPSFTLIGFDLFGFIKNKNVEKHNLFGGASLLQTLRSFISGIGDQKHYTEEEELVETGRLLATHLGEKEVISAAADLMPQNIVEEIISKPFIPEVSQKSPAVSDILELPKTVFDIFSSN